MRIVVPYTEPYTDGDGLARGLRPEVKERFEGRAEFVNVGSERTQYFELVAGLWRSRETFCLIEQDVLPELHDLEEMEGCPEAWCLCPYPGPPWVGLLTDCLGCTRFSSDLIVAMPRLFEEVPYASGWRDHWLGVDRGVTRVLRRAGWRAHCHRTVPHLRDYGAGPPAEGIPAATDALRRLTRAAQAWPSADFVVQAAMVAAQAPELGKIDRAILFHHLAHCEDDLQCAGEAIRTLRRVLVAAAQEETVDLVSAWPSRP